MTKRTKLLIIIASCAYAIAWYLVTQYAAQAYVNSRFDAQKEQARQQVSLAKSTFEAIIFKDIYLADSLATVVNIEPQFAIDNWESISAKLMSKSTHVRNVAMAPNDIIQFLYPLAGNEQALGFEYQSRPQQFASVMTAKRTGSLVIDGLLTRWGQPPRFAVVNVDLNRFKKVNDDLGHDAGDELLKHIANHMLSRVRATDFVARIGGDEFIIVLGRVRDEAAIKRFVEKLKIDIERTPLEYHGELIYPSLSIGYSIADGNKTREALLSEADREMYAMKLAQRTELS